MSEPARRNAALRALADMESMGADLQATAAKMRGTLNGWQPTTPAQRRTHAQLVEVHQSVQAIARNLQRRAEEL